MDANLGLWLLLRLFILLVTGAVLFLVWRKVKTAYKKPFLLSLLGAVLLTLIGAVLLLSAMTWSDVKNNYGWVLLFGLPLCNGLFAVSLFHWLCREQELTPYKPGAFVTLVVLLPLLVVGLELLLLFALLLEGIICILMAAPFMLVGTMLGALLGYLGMRIIQKITGRQLLSVFIAGLLPLGLQPLETRHWIKEAYAPVTTEMIINAPPSKVFDLVVAFPEITDRTPRSWGEGMFVMGLPEPEKATVACRDEGCMRRCHFTQNVHFDERITVYKPGEELSFSVQAVVGPQHPVTGADPHVLPGGVYFETDRGQFLLYEIAPGKTLLKGTSWYRMRSSFNWYAQPWAEWMLHAIHSRVLRHVKQLAEQQA